MTHKTRNHAVKKKDSSFLRDLHVRENGNLFFYILLAVALFAALTYTVSRGMRGNNVTTMSKRKSGLIATDIITYAQKIERSVSNLRRENISESDICFTHNQNSAVNNAAYSSISTCADDTYRLYHPNGGGLTLKQASTDWLESSHSGDQSYGEWVFTNVNGVQDIGNSIMSETSSMELIAFIPHLKEDLCQAINKHLSIGSTIPNNANAFDPSPVNNGFTTTSGEINAAELQGKYSGCFKSTNTWDTYIFYQVLIER